HEADVPLNAIYKAWHMDGRMSPGYYATDLATEIMGNGFASRLHLKLVKEKKLFSNINCYHTGSLDPGLVVIEGKIVEGQTLEEANAAIDEEIEKLLEFGVTGEELEKAKNKIEAMMTFEDMTLLSRANNLAFYELLGDANLINSELAKYNSVTAESLLETVRKVFRKENSNTLFYKKKKG
ncbi:MAG: insulinase family protein, partial [Taibaiella sp.]|nr:insulinase family protein [Taibaiella sp.]